MPKKEQTLHTEAADILTNENNRLRQEISDLNERLIVLSSRYADEFNAHNETKIRLRQLTQLNQSLLQQQNQEPSVPHLPPVLQ